MKILNFIHNKWNLFLRKKLLNKVINISNKYDLSPIVLPKKYKNIYHYLQKYPNKKNKFISEKDDLYFLKKYKNFIEIGYYGFAIGEPINVNWNYFLDEVLELIIKYDPNFRIHQIKSKYGRICFYCYSNIIKDLNLIEIFISQKLYDKNLIY